MDEEVEQLKASEEESSFTIGDSPDRDKEGEKGASRLVQSNLRKFPRNIRHYLKSDKSNKTTSKKSAKSHVASKTVSS